MKISRRKLAQYTAHQLESGNDGVIREVAAYLVHENRTKELPLLVRDIEAMYAENGTVVASVTTARKLDAAIIAELQKSIAELTNAKRVELRTLVDESVLGGVRVEVPGAELDATIQAKLRTLRAAKV